MKYLDKSGLLSNKFLKFFCKFHIKASKANWSLDEIDLFEINEAFSSQCIAIQRELKLDESKVIKN
jgi:hypothetical protein